MKIGHNLIDIPVLGELPSEFPRAVGYTKEEILAIIAERRIPDALRGWKLYIIHSVHIQVQRINLCTLHTYQVKKNILPFFVSDIVQSEQDIRSNRFFKDCPQRFAIRVVNPDFDLFTFNLVPQ